MPEPSPSIPRSIVIATSAIALLILAVAYTYHFLHWDFDDAYIIFRIVRNLLNGHEWAFNVGEAHNASTSALNTIVVALVAPIFSSNIPFTAHVLAGVWLWIAALAFGWVFWQRFEAWVALGAGAGLIVMLGDNILWGLETHLFVALMGIFVVLKHRRSSSWVVIGLLTLTRPDGLIFAGLRFLRDARGSGPPNMAWWRERVGAAWTANRRGLLIFVLVLAPWVIFSLASFHQLFPDTLANKMWQGQSGFWGKGHIYLEALWDHVSQATPWRQAAYLLALPGLVFLIRDRSAVLYVVAFAAVQQVAYTLLNVPGYHWYFASLDVAVVLAGSYGVGSLFEIVIERHLRTRIRYLPIAVYISIVVFVVIGAQPLFGAQYPQDQRERSYRMVAETMVANGIPAGPIATVEVGTLGYYLPEHSFVDFIGLTSANPEYLSGRHNNEFFATLPGTVLLHAPSVSPLEQAIFDDIRFQMMYESPVVMPTVQPPMQYFTLRPGARPPSREEMASYVKQRYAAFQVEAAGSMAEAQPSGDAVCSLATVNGRLASEPVEVPRILMSLAGWAFDRSAGAPTPEVFAVLESGERRYAMRADRLARPDVAAAFKEPRFEMSGYRLQGSIVDLPLGKYRASVIQKRGETFVSCDVASAIRVVEAVR